MLNYIILGLSAFSLILSTILVIAEKTPVSNNFPRFVRICLREKSGTSFCLDSALLLLICLIFHHKGFAMIFAAIGVKFVTLVILHPRDFFSVNKSRKKASRKKEMPLRYLSDIKTKEIGEALTKVTPIN